MKKFPTHPTQHLFLNHLTCNYVFIHFFLFFCLFFFIIILPRHLTWELLNREGERDVSGGIYYCARDSFQFLSFLSFVTIVATGFYFWPFSTQSPKKILLLLFACCYDVPMSQDDYNEMLFSSYQLWMRKRERRRRRKRPEKIIISITIA